MKCATLILITVLCAWSPSAPAQHHPKKPAASPAVASTEGDTRIVDSVRVLCLYGSIPAKGWWGREPMYGPNSVLGRMVKLHGGHVTIEYAHDKALSFQPVHYDGIGGAGHIMPRSGNKNFNSCFAYTGKAPYDYAFFGMRCASASYQFLLEAGLVREYKHNIWMNVFTTRDFRNALYKDYERNRDKGWRLETTRGSRSRQWEKDTEDLRP